MKVTNSQHRYREALSLMPGGVSSPVRAFRGVGGEPLFIKRGEGPYVWDLDGNRYIDYVLSWGSLALGHAHPSVIEAVQRQTALGLSYGAPTELEIRLANLVIDALPSIEMVRFVNSGTEASMSALRLARAYTGRDNIVKFDGCYHGHPDPLLVRAGSGVATLGLPDSPGVPARVTENTLVASFNDLQSVAAVFAEYAEQIAGVIVEPVGGNMGVLPPKQGFLDGLRQLTERYGALLIFDEVMTGFRVSPGGAQQLYDLRPDITILGKVIGGGLPVGAYAGPRAIMETVAPAGPMYQAGTLSGNPLAMAAGIATLTEFLKPGVFEGVAQKAQRLGDGIGEAARSAGMAVWQNRVGTMFSTFFTDEPVFDAASARTSDTELFARFFHLMLERGVYLAPSQFEAGFISTVHSDEVIDETIDVAREALDELLGD